MRKLLWLTVAAAAGVLLSVTLARVHQTAQNAQPAVAAGDNGPQADHSDRNIIRQWLDHPFDGGDPPVRFRIVQPGMILPPGAGTRTHVPGDMSITITRHGDKPARISVQQGDKKWEVNEEALDKLPPEVRPYVDRLLGPLWRTPTDGQKVFDLAPDWPASVPGPEIPLQAHLNRELEEMNRQMEQLRRRLEDLRAD